MTGSSNSCGACKFLRRKCTRECVFAPYFSYEEAAVHFAAVHKVFGASNASRMLLHLPHQHRSQAAIAISFEAFARMQNPVHGCVAYIYALQQQIASLEQQLGVVARHISTKNIGNGAAIDSGDSQGFNNTATQKSLNLWNSRHAEYEPSSVCSCSMSLNLVSEAQPAMPMSIPYRCEEQTHLGISHPWPDERLHHRSTFDISQWLDN